MYVLNFTICFLHLPVSASTPPFEKSTTPQVVSTSLQPVVSTTTPKEGTPISEVSVSTAQPTTPPTPGTVESTTGKVLGETTPAAPGTTQPATTTSVVEITSEQTAPTPAPETTQPPGGLINSEEHNVVFPHCILHANTLAALLNKIMNSCYKTFNRMNSLLNTVIAFL